MREQLLATEVKRVDAVIFTHDHADQTHGIDDIRALAIRNRAQVDAFMDAATERTLVTKFNYAFQGGEWISTGLSIAAIDPSVSFI